MRLYYTNLVITDWLQCRTFMVSVL